MTTCKKLHAKQNVSSILKQKATLEYLMMNKISFNILSCPESNDHEMRIIIDNEDFLGIDYLGIDPHVFFSRDNFDKNGELMIGRCTCGCEGCSDYPVTVSINDSTISWTN